VSLAHGKGDSNVPFSQFKKMRGAAEKAAVPVELLEIEDEGHSFSKPENEQKWYDTLIAFLAKHNPAERGASRLPAPLPTRTK
jgi:dipeptidyl aminopeptidase/acylaminoacyl peptidase